MSAAGRGCSVVAIDRRARANGLGHTVSNRLPTRALLGHRHHDEVCEQEPVRVQIPADNCRILMSSDDDDGAIGGDRRQRRAAPVEEHEVGSKADGDARSVSDVRGSDGSCEPSTAPPTANGRHPDESGGLEVIRCGMSPRSRERDERVDVGGTVTTSGSGGPPLPIATTTTRRSTARSRAT